MTEQTRLALRILPVMPNAPKWIASCSLAILVALYVVGAVSHGSLRHEVQTLVLWFPIVLWFQRREMAKWAALPCLVFWLVIMIFIWLFLLGWAHLLSGHFSPVEIALTMVIGIASATGIAVCLRWRTATGGPAAAGAAILSGLLQLLVFRISLIPFIARQ